MLTAAPGKPPRDGSFWGLGPRSALGSAWLARAPTPRLGVGVQRGGRADGL